MNSVEVRVTFDWQPAEHAEVTQILLQPRIPLLSRWSLEWMRYPLFFGWTIGVVIDVFLNGSSGFLYNTTPWLLFIAFWWWLATRGYAFNAARQTARLSPEVHYPITHVFGDHGLKVIAEGANVELAWNRMTEAREEDAFFLFFWDAKAAHFTPKRGMTIEAQNQLRRLAEQHLGANSKMRPLIAPPPGR